MQIALLECLDQGECPEETETEEGAIAHPHGLSHAVEPHAVEPHAVAPPEASTASGEGGDGGGGVRVEVQHLVDELLFVEVRTMHHA